MRKSTVSLVFFILLTSAVLSACNREVLNGENTYVDLDLIEGLPISSPLQTNPYLDDVKFTINNNVLTVGIDSLKLTIINNSYTTILFGDCFSIEYWSGSQWMSLHDASKAVCTLVEHRLHPGQSRISDNELSFLPENSLTSAGLYRIRKNISIDGISDSEYDVVVEFYVE